MAKQTKTISNKTWRPTPEDLKLWNALKQHFGIQNDSDLVRMALRALSAKEGVAA